MSRSILLGDDEKEAADSIVSDALLRLDPGLDAPVVMRDALSKADKSDIPTEHAAFHAFASGALYDAVSERVGDGLADRLMGDVGRMWRLLSLQQKEARSAPPKQGDELSGIAVLVVDDDALARRALARALPDFGACIYTASDAESAMQLARSESPDVIVADYDMPGESGATLASMIALAMGHEAPPVICLTGVTPAPENRSFHAILSKPVHPAKLVAAIRDAIDAANEPAPPSAIDFRRDDVETGD